MHSIYCSPDLVQYCSPTMEHLANTLRALASSKVNLLAVAKALERHANEGDIVAVAQYVTIKVA